MADTSVQLQANESTCKSAGGFDFLWTPFALVPNKLLDEETPDLWLNFLRDRIPHDQIIRREKVAKQGCTCLYEFRPHTEELPHVVPFLVKECMRHESTCLAAIRQGDRLAVTVITDGKLQLANIYDSSTKEQTLYWILSICEQLALPQATPLYIRCGVSTRKLLNAHLETRDL